MNVFLFYARLRVGHHNIFGFSGVVQTTPFLFLVFLEVSTLEHILKKDIPYFTDCEPLVENEGFKLVDLAVFKKNEDWQVKAVIKSKQTTGAGIKDCSLIHRILQPRIEALLNSQNVSMEVSSPGINRIIKRSTEFYAFLGEYIEIWDIAFTDWRRGILKDITADNIILNIDGTDNLIPYSNIKKARCNF